MLNLCFMSCYKNGTMEYNNLYEHFTNFTNSIFTILSKIQVFNAKKNNLHSKSFISSFKL